jgi:hypothetical protein
MVEKQTTTEWTGLTYSLSIEWVGILRFCTAQPALFSRHLSVTETKSVVREHPSYDETTYIAYARRRQRHYYFSTTFGRRYVDTLPLDF